MKKIFITLITVLIMASTSHAAQVCITIDDTKLSDIRDSFLASNPIPPDKDGNPKYTPLQWFKIWIQNQIQEQVKAGKKMLLDKSRENSDKTVIDSTASGVQ